MCRLLNQNLSIAKILIKNLPICINCLHFIKPLINVRNNYDQFLICELYGRCKKFGKINLITGKIEYVAKNCRLNVEKCGYISTEYAVKTKY